MRSSVLSVKVLTIILLSLSWRRSSERSMQTLSASPGHRSLAWILESLWRSSYLRTVHQLFFPWRWPAVTWHRTTGERPLLCRVPPLCLSTPLLPYCLMFSKFGFNPNPLFLPSLVSPPGLLSRSWKTGLKLCPSTRNWGSPCQLSWMNCIKVWVGSTGRRTPLQTRTQIKHQTQQQPLQTRRAWLTKTPSGFLHPSEVLH